LVHYYSIRRASAQREKKGRKKKFGAAPLSRSDDILTLVERKKGERFFLKSLTRSDKEAESVTTGKKRKERVVLYQHVFFSKTQEGAPPPISIA